MRLVRILPPLLLLAVLAALLLAAGDRTLVPFLLMPAVMLVPALFVPRNHPSAEPDDDDDGGQRRRRPPPRPRGPTGGIPLPDAVQSRTRTRDQGPVMLRTSFSRRPATGPARTPGRRPVPSRRPSN